MASGSSSLRREWGFSDRKRLHAARRSSRDGKGSDGDRARGGEEGGRARAEETLWPGSEKLEESGAMVGARVTVRVAIVDAEAAANAEEGAADRAAPPPPTSTTIALPLFTVGAPSEEVSIGTPALKPGGGAGRAEPAPAA